MLSYFGKNEEKKHVLFLSENKPTMLDHVGCRLICLGDL